MEIVLVLAVVAIFAGVVVVAQKLHAARYWSAPSNGAAAESSQRPEKDERETSSEESEAEALAFVERYASEKWREGFLSRDEVINMTLDALDDEYPGSSAIDRVERAFERAAAQLASEQATWPPVTDCDRLTEVFAKLDRAGIVAAENFSCCNNCGHGEMLSEIEQERLTRPVRGYAFYHAQDTERAVQGGGLYVRYGSDIDDDAASVLVGREVFNALSEAGFKPEWNGSDSEAIFVPMTWRKRRSAA